MVRPKNRYKVYGYYEGYLGETYAVSEEKAINNVLFATGHLGYDRDDYYIDPCDCWAEEQEKPVFKSFSMPSVPVVPKPKPVEPPKPAEPEWENISLFDRSYEW